MGSRIGFGEHGCDGVALNTHAHPVRDFDLHLTVIDDLGDLAVHTTSGDDPVAAAQSFHHVAVLFHLLLLRTDQQEVENNEDENKRQKGHDHVAAAGSLGKDRDKIHQTSPNDAAVLRTAFNR